VLREMVSRRRTGSTGPGIFRRMRCRSSDLQDFIRSVGTRPAAMTATHLLSRPGPYFIEYSLRRRVKNLLCRCPLGGNGIMVNEATPDDDASNVMQA
jgi:hypothetical protein